MTTKTLTEKEIAQKLMDISNKLEGYASTIYGSEEILFREIRAELKACAALLWTGKVGIELR